MDGTALTAPYRVIAIGDPKTLDTALNIPGGVAAIVRTERRRADASASGRSVTITAVADAADAEVRQAVTLSASGVARRATPAVPSAMGMVAPCPTSLTS